MAVTIGAGRFITSERKDFDMADMKDVNSAKKLAMKVASDPTFAQEFRTDPVPALQAVALNESIPNNEVYWMIVGFIGAALVLSLGGAIALLVLASGSQVPDILITTASTALGALAGALIPAGRGRSDTNAS